MPASVSTSCVARLGVVHGKSRIMESDLKVSTRLNFCGSSKSFRSPLDERTREGDDHPARLFLRFITDRGEKRAMEVIWGNRLKPGDYKYIGGFPHFVADSGDDRVGRWLDERIDLARVYAEIWEDAAPAYLVDVAVFCDGDDTHTASISYFAHVRLERR